MSAACSAMQQEIIIGIVQEFKKELYAYKRGFFTKTILDIWRIEEMAFLQLCEIITLLFDGLSPPNLDKFSATR